MSEQFETRMETVVTADGWRLPLRRFTPSVRRDPVPVLCVHGHATNGWSWHGGPRQGVVGGLLDAGREVFVVDLRGAAATQAPRRGAPVRIADKLLEDVPAAIAHLLARPESRHLGTDRVDVVGHSLGGVIIYLLGLAHEPIAARIRRAVTLGSPLRVPESAIPAPLLGRSLQRVVSRLGRLPVCGLAAHLGRHAPRSAFPTHFTPGEVDLATFDAFMKLGVTDVFGPELAELSAWVQAGDARVLHPRLSASGAPGRLPFPTRFMVGADDGLTTAASVTATHALLGGDHSDLCVLPRFRHADILIGRRAAAEVVPHVVSWLDAPAEPAWDAAWLDPRPTLRRTRRPAPAPTRECRASSSASSERWWTAAT